MRASNCWSSARSQRTTAAPGRFSPANGSPTPDCNERNPNARERTRRPDRTLGVGLGSERHRVEKRDPPPVTVSPEHDRRRCLERLLSFVEFVGLFEYERDDSCCFPVAAVKVARLRVEVADRVAQLFEVGVDRGTPADPA